MREKKPRIIQEVRALILGCNDVNISSVRFYNLLHKNLKNHLIAIRWFDLGDLLNLTKREQG